MKESEVALRSTKHVHLLVYLTAGGLKIGGVGALGIHERSQMAESRIGGRDMRVLMGVVGEDQSLMITWVCFGPRCLVGKDIKGSCSGTTSSNNNHCEHRCMSFGTDSVPDFLHQQQQQQHSLIELLDHPIYFSFILYNISCPTPFLISLVDVM